MFYDTRKNNHNLPYDPFKSCIIPRPIGWISSQDLDGNLNLAPYSYFNAVCDEPPMIMFSSLGLHAEDDGPKDTIKNIKETGQFVVNIATYHLREAVNLTSASIKRTQNEFQFAALESTPSVLVKPPRVKNSPIHLECIYHQSIQLLTDHANMLNEMVIGKVIGIHIDDDIISNGKVDVAKMKPIARLGYADYAVVKDVFSMRRPD